MSKFAPIMKIAELESVVPVARFVVEESRKSWNGRGFTCHLILNKEKCGYYTINSNLIVLEDLGLNELVRNARICRVASLERLSLEPHIVPGAIVFVERMEDRQVALREPSLLVVNYGQQTGPIIPDQATPEDVTHLTTYSRVV